MESQGFSQRAGLNLVMEVSLHPIVWEELAGATVSVEIINDTFKMDPMAVVWNF